jgi:hypothetical protein
VETDSPLDESDQARASRQIEKHRRVTLGEPAIERTAVVAVQDPPLARDQPLYRPRPVLFAGLYPPRLPVHRVEVNQGKAGDRSQLGGEGGFARASRSNHEHSTHTGDERG